MRLNNINIFKITLIIGMAFSSFSVAKSFNDVRTFSFEKPVLNKRYVEDDKLIDLYKRAYNLTINKKMPLCSYEQFKELHRDYSLEEDLFLKEILRLSEESLNYETITPFSSDIADYILMDNSNHSSTPLSQFRKGFIPQYSMFDYSDVEVGDLIIEYSGIIGTFTGHVALVADVNKNFNGGTYIQTIESVGGVGVTYGFYDDMRTINYNAKLYKPKYQLTSDQKEKIKFFAESQIGDTYNTNFNDKKTDIYANTWFCSELIYAAYKYSGYSIKNMDRVWPADFVNSDDFIETSILKVIDVSIWNNGGSFASWNIGIKNDSSIGLTIEYNTKMCFTNDARNWQNLNDIRNIYLPVNSTNYVEIGFNWFADAVALSCKVGSNRYIMFGNLLDGTVSSMVTYYKIVPYGN